MSDICVNLAMPSYLRQWFINRHGGCEPVKLVRGSAESELLRMYTVRQPDGAVILPKQEGEVAICIPSYKNHDPRTYNYLTKLGKEALLDIIKNDFRVDMWDYLHDFDKYGRELKSLILLYMELRGIKETGSCWDRIAKIYQRKRNSYKTSEKRKMKKSHTTSRCFL